MQESTLESNVQSSYLRKYIFTKHVLNTKCMCIYLFSKFWPASHMFDTPGLYYVCICVLG